MNLKGKNNSPLQIKMIIYSYISKKVTKTTIEKMV